MTYHLAQRCKPFAAKLGAVCTDFELAQRVFMPLEHAERLEDVVAIGALNRLEEKQ